MMVRTFTEHPVLAPYAAAVIILAVLAGIVQELLQ